MKRGSMNIIRETAGKRIRTHELEGSVGTPLGIVSPSPEDTKCTEPLLQDAVSCMLTRGSNAQEEISRFVPL